VCVCNLASKDQLVVVTIHPSLRVDVSHIVAPNSS
jgi:hypothetical protein